MREEALTLDEVSQNTTETCTILESNIRTSVEGIKSVPVAGQEVAGSKGQPLQEWKQIILKE
eukprot:614887-Prorocentrum_lima.AAC.1